MEQLIRRVAVDKKKSEFLLDESMWDEFPKGIYGEEAL